MTRYERTQVGTAMVIGTLGGAAVGGIVMAAFLSRATLDAVPWLPWAFFAVLVGAFLLVGWMRVVVDDRELRAVMGIGLLRRTVELADVRKADVVRTRVLWGWGVHLTPVGWLYNVGGRWAVRLELATERPLMIGSADPEGLLAAVEEARAPAQRSR